MLLFIEHQTARIQPFIEDLKLEERAAMTNWILFIVTSCMSLGIITGGIAPFIFIAAAPLIGWVSPSIIAYFNRKKSPGNVQHTFNDQEAHINDAITDWNEGGYWSSTMSYSP